jgi:hypothetical protein
VTQKSTQSTLTAAATLAPATTPRIQAVQAVQVEVPAVIVVLAVLPLDLTVTMAAVAVETSVVQAVVLEQQVETEVLLPQRGVPVLPEWE